MDYPIGTIIYKRKKLIEKLINKYGEEIICDFEKLKCVPFSTLKALSEKHGFSKERARQIYFELFGEPYTCKKKEKSSRIAAEKNFNGCVNNPFHKVANYRHGGCIYEGAKAEKIFYEECLKRGMEVKPPNDRSVDLIVNGFKVEIKSYVKLYLQKKCNAYYERFSLSKKQLEEKPFDFLALYSKQKEQFYIIPRSRVRGGGLFFRVGELKRDFYSKRKNYYEDCLNGWEFLKLEGLH